jgi:ATP-binding cassette subfamily B multidrug efflux pump
LDKNVQKEVNQSTHLRELLRLNRYFHSYKREVVLGSFYLTLSNLFLVWIPVLIRQSIDRLENLLNQQGLGYGDLTTILFQSEYTFLLLEYPLYLLLASLLYGYLLFETRQNLIVASRHIEYDMRKEVFDHLQRLPQTYYSETKTGDIFVRVTEDINRVRDYFGPAYMYMLNTITRAGIIITVMVWVNMELTMWALLPLPLLSVIAYKISTYINTRSTEIQEQYAVLANRAHETFSSIRLIKAYAREAYEYERFEHESEQYRKAKLKLAIVESLFFPLMNLLIGFSTIFVIWKGGQLVMTGSLTIGNIAEYIIYVTYLTWPVTALGYTLNLLQRSAASQKRLADLMAEPIETDLSSTSDFRVPLRGQIEFKQVSFRYPGASHYALKDLNFSIPAGASVAFVGRTGSGKSTLIQLLPRMLEPTEGKIYIDDKELHAIPLSHLRQSIGVVPQETFLFSDTIAENIAFGMTSASEDDVKKAADQAQLLETINEFDKKFETILGERGITLSGGQKQRLAIARAIIKTPNILLLDDALSAVDSKTEESLSQVLSEALKHTTKIYISHRLSTIRHCSIIYVLDNGSIVEQGNHTELLDLDGVYASLHRKQLIELELESL